MEGYIEIEKYQKLEAELSSFKKEAFQQISELKFQLEQLKRAVFGAKSERYISDSSADQLSLFDLAAKEKVEEKVSVPAHDRTKSKPKKKPARLKLPAHLKRKERIVEPEVDLTDMVRIGERRTEILHYTEAELWVEVIVRPKYAPKPSASQAQDKEAQKAVVIAGLPPRFIDKCIAGESLLRLIICDKYLDHLPLYRIQGRLKRMDMVIPRSTICGWVAQSANRLEVLYNKLGQIVLASDYLQVDETRIEVLPGKGKSPPKGKKRKTHRGFFWGYHGVLKKLIFFDYSPRRTATNPTEHLQHFEGVLQTDCYDAYDEVRKLYRTLIHYHCLGHARREFEKALANDAQRAGHAMEQFQQLYAIERKAQEQQLNTHAIYELRQKEARPILEKLFDWMDEEYPKLPPRSAIAKAMAYMLKRKERMMYYLKDGRLHIDTNRIENLIRPIAVGRRNFLFAGSHQGAQRAAIFYSLFACCKLNDVDPVEWLTDVMTRLPEHPVNRVEELLPNLWKNEKETEKEG
ncbi:MAG: IS66 family transposase [Candidatus Brocadiaceae bacterium]|nr:IS66 family transposase [Candidatus Brocadiaceae bacterium]